jgi:hypothetical protein
MQKLMNCDGVNIMDWRILRTQKIHDFLKELNYKQIQSIAYFNHETFSVLRMLVKLRVQRTMSTIRGSISEDGKYGVN